MKVAIVGGGLFGSIAGILAAQDGHQVTIYDDDNPHAGSKPAACLIRPSWLGKVQGADIGLDVLASNFPTRRLQFDIWGSPVGCDVLWVPPKEIFKKATKLCETRRATVTGLRHDAISSLVCVGAKHDSRNWTRYDALLVAAGVWCREILDHIPEIRALAGVAFLFVGEIERPSIKVWAPYKQIVAFNRGDGAWVGDGSAILEKNWTDKRTEQCLERCRSLAPYAGYNGPDRTLFGLRPYVAGKPGGYFERIQNRTWVSTGGAKNGTVIAAYQAHLFREELRRLR